MLKLSLSPKYSYSTVKDLQTGLYSPGSSFGSKVGLLYCSTSFMDKAEATGVLGAIPPGICPALLSGTTHMLLLAGSLNHVRSTAHFSPPLLHLQPVWPEGGDPGANKGKKRCPHLCVLASATGWGEQGCRVHEVLFLIGCGAWLR